MTLTDEDRAVIDRLLSNTLDVSHAIDTIYLAAVAATIERCAKVCDDYPNWSESCEEWAGKFAAAIRALAED